MTVLGATRAPIATTSIGVIGAAAVGRAVAAGVVVAGICDELVLVSRSTDEAIALADDLNDMRAAARSTVIPAATSGVHDLRCCDAIVIAVRASFANTRGQHMRMGGLDANAPLIRDLAMALRHYSGQNVMVTNPVDLMARLFAETAGCGRVVGVGSNLDSVRYRLIVAHCLGVSVDAVSGSVIGEHGDSMTICAHATTVAGQPVAVPLAEVYAALTRRSPAIARTLGRTRFGPSGAVLSALRKCLGVEDGMEELASPYGGGFLGVRLRFERGVSTLSLPPLSPSEAQRFNASDHGLRAIYQRLRSHL